MISFQGSIAPIHTPKTFFREHLKLVPMESAFANFLTIDNDKITKLDQSIKFIKCYTSYYTLGSKGVWPTSRDLLLNFGSPSVSTE